MLHISLGWIKKAESLRKGERLSQGGYSKGSPGKGASVSEDPGKGGV